MTDFRARPYSGGAASGTSLAGVVVAGAASSRANARFDADAHAGG